MIDRDTVIASVDFLVYNIVANSDTPAVGDIVPLAVRLPVEVQRLSRSVAFIEGSR
jgi:hypothetical protein